MARRRRSDPDQELDPDEIEEKLEAEGVLDAVVCYETVAA